MREYQKPITTTLNRIREHAPCTEGWSKLLKGLGKTAPDDEPLPFSKILRINGLDDALWCLRAEPQHANLWRLMATRFARQVEHLMTDQRSRNALDVAERHANGQATDAELAVARTAAWAAALAAWAAAKDASDAASSAAWDAASSAEWAASRNASDAAWAPARNATMDDQTEIFLEIVGDTDA